MNVENLSNAHYIYNEMKELQRQKGILESGAGLGVTIQSAYQYSAFLEAICPHAVAELNSRVEEKKSALVNLGASFSIYEHNKAGWKPA
ncbi:TPA: hypothetical protein NY126_001467 [Escherichia coli]|uniref:hypothetical protein n=1 Tax=Escherichia coli TaxID=562 RepID=UPI001A0D3DEB|nr:hypothetical protein [Escherichia coli]EGO0756753.1 hypothetical protein [Escherichia coli]EJT8579630.1 hypothetical protein [Escherichia coli]HBH7191181.1 hypothetical protein [Escherichia coli]HCK0887753.1 hypothetical protein [Escherichia coli]